MIRRVFVSRPSLLFRPVSHSRLFASASVSDDRGERIRQTLATALKPTILDVQDISGGCGQSFHVRVHSAAFAGKSLVQQHQVVNALLKDEIAAIHALQVETKAIATS
jgi:stress-induced morphogen